MTEETTAIARPENLTGPRIVAGFIDVILVAILGVAMAAIFGEVGSTEDEDFTIELNGLPFLLYLALGFAYYFVMESAGGQTIGKRIMGLKVAALDGSLTPGKVAIRTILRVVDGFALYLVGLIVVAISKQNQRIGDMAAGTIIVRASSSNE